MSVYTSISDQEMHDFLQAYNIGKFLSLQGIAQGITNSNYFINTSQGRFVLTVFEALTQAELPFFLKLKQHLSQNGVACPTPIPQKNNKLEATLANKPACIVSCLNGTDVSWPTTQQCFNTGKMLAKMHIAGQDFPLHMENPRYLSWWHEASKKLFPLLNKEDSILLKTTVADIDKYPTEHLPNGIIHADLFKDNVLLQGDEVSGFIDFYYACNGSFIYDIAIAINDWARNSNNILDNSLEQAFLSGYEEIRPLTESERLYYPIAKRAGCLRFWVSRLLDFHFPQEGEMTFIKDPNIFRDLLLSFNQHQTQI